MVVRLDGLPLGASNSCFYCGCYVTKWKQQMYEKPPKNGFTLDHVIPQCRGGRNGITVTACVSCNQDKNHLDIEEYRVLQAFRAGLLPVPDYRFAAETRV